MPMFRLHVRFSHQRGLLGAICSGGPGMRAELGQKPEGWPGKGGRRGGLLTVDLDELGQVGEEPCQLLPGQQALLLHPLVEDQVQHPECAQMGSLCHKQL